MLQYHLFVTVDYFILSLVLLGFCYKQAWCHKEDAVPQILTHTAVAGKQIGVQYSVDSFCCIKVTCVLLQ